MAEKVSNGRPSGPIVHKRLVSAWNATSKPANDAALAPGTTDNTPAITVNATAPTVATLAALLRVRAGASFSGPPNFGSNLIPNLPDLMRSNALLSSTRQSPAGVHRMAVDAKVVNALTSRHE